MTLKGHVRSKYNTDDLAQIESAILKLESGERVVSVLMAIMMLNRLKLMFLI